MSLGKYEDTVKHSYKEMYYFKSLTVLIYSFYIRRGRRNAENDIVATEEIIFTSVLKVRISFIFEILNLFSCPLYTCSLFNVHILFKE